jgi:hypothetical protein
VRDEDGLKYFLTDHLGSIVAITGSKPGCNDAGYFYGDIPPKGSDRNFNHKEDFAESVAAFVYPDIATRKVQKNYSKTSPLYYDNYRTTKRWKFIDRLMQ